MEKYKGPEFCVFRERRTKAYQVFYAENLACRSCVALLSHWSTVRSYPACGQKRFNSFPDYKCRIWEVLSAQ